MGAITRAPLGVVRSLPESRRMLEQAMVEIESLARARGVHLPDDAVASAMTYADASPETAMSSIPVSKDSPSTKAKLIFRFPGIRCSMSPLT